MSIKLSDCVIQAYSENKMHQYVCVESSGKFVLGVKNNKNGKRIYFDDLITKLETESKSLDATQRKQLAVAVKKMSERKFRNAYGGDCIDRIVGVFCEFVSCFQNLFSGFGFQTSCDRADTLAKELEKALSADSKSNSKADGKSVVKEKNIRSLNPAPDHVFIKRNYEQVNDKLARFMAPIEIGPELYDGYAKEYYGLHKEHVSMTSGSFTYIGAGCRTNAIRQGTEALFDAKALWAGSWRAIVNQLDNLRHELYLDHSVKPENGSKDEISMIDIQNLTGLKAGARLSPAESAELFFRYVKMAYSETDQKKIFELVEPRGYLFLDNAEGSHHKISYDDWMKKVIANHVSLLALKDTDKQPFRLIELAKHFWKKDSPELTNMDGIAKGAQEGSELTAHLVKFNDLYGKTYTQENERLTAWIAYLALVKLFPEPACQGTENIDPAKFPKLDKQNPIPLMIDDSYSARNLYGYHVKDKKVQDVFIGETNVGILSVSSNPWTACGWMDVSQIHIDEGQLMVLGIMHK